MAEMTGRDPLVDGIDIPEPNADDVENVREIRDQQAEPRPRPTLLDLGTKALAQYVRKRWDRLEEPQRQRLTEIKVNYLRYSGHSFVQVHPGDPNRIFMPPGASTKRAPTINKIRRGVQRYVAQVTADDPVMEGMPESHSDDARDAAESSTKALRGEWQRMNMTTELQRTVHFSAIMRSSFWMFEWDATAGGETTAMKFFPNDKGERVLLPVLPNGKPTDDASKAAKVRQGDMRLEVMTPANVRWEGGRYAHDASEVIVGKVMTLRKLYDAIPATREVKLGDLGVGKYDSPINGVEWLEDIRAETPRGTKKEYSEEMLERTHGQLADNDNMLDEYVMVLYYFRAPDRTYKKGFQSLVVGDWVSDRHKGPLRYGKIPVVQFKFLDEVGDPLGHGLVDLLREPQELLDFVNGQILRYLQMMKRRWFVPLHSGVKHRDLSSPTRSIIEFNAAAGAPIPEVQPEIPNSMIQFVERFDNEWDDQLGIHDTLQGKHVPGVSSGRHAEALRSGDETLLGLTRNQIKLSLERAAEIQLAIIQREWKTERRVRYMGDDREYVDQAFRSTDFGGTGQVVLKNSTLLMLTPAQRMDTIMALAEAGALGAEEVRQLAPLGDVMGISLSEDVHYQRARRQNARFLEGPPKKLVKARDDYEAAISAAQAQQQAVDRMASLGGHPDAVMAAHKATEDALAEAELLWREALDKYAWDHRSWEDRKDIARIHAGVHADALASAKADRLPEWWVDAFEDHATLEYEMGFPELVVEAAQAKALAAGPQQPKEPLDTGDVNTSPPGTEFVPGTPDVVTGGATGAP